MSVTLSLEAIAVAVYIAGFLFIEGFFVADEMSFVNPEYKKMTVFALLWPIGVVLVIFQYVTGIYIADQWRNLKDWWQKYRCPHTAKESVDTEIRTSEGELREAEHYCHDCGNVWWKE